MKTMEHKMDCATNAAEVCDEFAAMGCTCGADKADWKDELKLAVKNIMEDAITEHDQEIESIIPATFYAGLELEERLKMLVSVWQRAIEVNQQLQVDKLEGGSE